MRSKDEALWFVLELLDSYDTYVTDSNEWFLGEPAADDLLLRNIRMGESIVRRMLGIEIAEESNG